MIRLSNEQVRILRSEHGWALETIRAIETAIESVQPVAMPAEPGAWHDRARLLATTAVRQAHLQNKDLAANKLLDLFDHLAAVPAAPVRAEPDALAAFDTLTAPPVVAEKAIPTEEYLLQYSRAVVTDEDERRACLTIFNTEDTSSRYEVRHALEGFVRARYREMIRRDRQQIALLNKIDQLT